MFWFDSLLLLFSLTHSLFFTLFQHPIIFTIHYSLIDGKILNHNGTVVTEVDGVNEGERRRRGHCTSLLEGSNRKDSLRECLIELNLEFDSSCYFISLLFLFLLSLFIYSDMHTFSD